MHLTKPTKVHKIPVSGQVHHGYEMKMHFMTDLFYVRFDQINRPDPGIKRFILTAFGY